MANLETNFIGMTSPNPFWIASGPPSDKDYNVHRAFEAGWGGVVWKTLGENPHIGNVNGPRYAVLHGNDRQVIGFNNIELITDRPLQTNLKEMTQIKRDWPDRPLIASVMLPMNEASWAEYVPMIEDTGADAFELNFGCPHGMSERGMGAAVGQVPEYVQMAAEWCKKHASIPVIDKLTPNITHILHPAKAAKAGGADAVSLINTINSIMRVDCDSLTMYLTTDGMGTHCGYCGEAVKPIALNMVAEIARTAETHDIPFLDEKGMASVHDLVGKAVPSVTDWKYLNLNYIEKATIDQDLCIKCGKCHIACEDTSHQAITHTVDGERKFVVKDEECVVCNLCVGVCPIENCITMKPMTEGVDPRTGLEVNPEHADWRTHPNNPLKEQEG
jgi:dihydropyrimidine dehydrogenase (NAD+) subunit PreA